MAHPKYDAILIYRKFNEFINRNKRHFKDSRYLVDDEDEEMEEALRLYTDMEILNPLNPHYDLEKADVIDIGGGYTKWYE